MDIKNKVVGYPCNYKLKLVTIKFTCKKCGKPFLKDIDEEQYKYVLKDPFFLKSKTCSKCKLEQIRRVFKASKKTV